MNFLVKLSLIISKASIKQMLWLTVAHFILCSFGLVIVGCKSGLEAKSDEKIISGYLVKKDDPIYKTTVALMDQGRAFCTGVLVDKKLVLTAAHCLVSRPPQSSISVQFGSQHEGLLAVIPAASYQAHPGFDVSEISSSDIDPMPSAPKYDIGVILLQEDAPSWSKALPIKQIGEIKSGAKVILAGYGRTDGIVKDVHGNMPEPRGYLRKTDGKIVTLNPNGKEIIEESTAENPLGSSCHGDSGGPMFHVDEDNSLVLIGVTSRGYSRDYDCKGKGVYTDVKMYIPWIKETVQKLMASMEKNLQWQHRYFEAQNDIKIALDYKLAEKGLEQVGGVVWVNITGSAMTGNEKVIVKLSSYVHSLRQETILLDYAGQGRFTGVFPKLQGEILCSRSSRWGIKQDLLITVDGKVLKSKEHQSEVFDFKFCN